LTGATPIQNVGAYGQEVADTIVSVKVMDRHTRQTQTLLPAACSFAYRSSAFKRDPDRFVVLSVTFALRPGGPPTLRYHELHQAVAGPAPTLSQVRATVLTLRRRKSMVLDPADPNRRSVGSFFTNPVVPVAELTRIVAQALDARLIGRADEVPHFPAGDGQVKLAAGWLIERAGMAKGTRQGAVGVSSQHALALVHHGGGTSAALVALARDIRDQVYQRFGVALLPEPALVGIDWPPPAESARP
jgi:UDP-N-acetylmuramate dehydrogenase